MIDGLLIGLAIQQAMDRAQPSPGTTLASSAKSKADALELEVAKLSMITEALWLLLKEKYGCTEDELVTKIDEIDMRDGQRDGRVAKQGPKICPTCGRTLMKHIPKCLYCGQDIQWEPFDK